jgi:hypothetical protein
LLARATTLTELDAAFSSATKDFPHRAVYAARYVELKGKDADSVLLSSLPNNGKQMEQLYGAQDTRDGQDLAVTDAYNTFYKAVSQAVRRRPEHLPHFLRMIHAYHYVDNVEEWPHLCELASTIYDQIPSQYIVAVKALEPEYRREALDCRKPLDAP